ncbi:MAG: hypothetical protein ACOYJ1_12670, partial [Peptococcales bacterium]
SKTHLRFKQLLILVFSRLRSFYLNSPNASLMIKLYGFCFEYLGQQAGATTGRPYIPTYQLSNLPTFWAKP